MSTAQMVTDYGTALVLVTAFGFFPSALIPYLIMERTRDWWIHKINRFDYLWENYMARSNIF
jgi:hypothetical protein